MYSGQRTPTIYGPDVYGRARPKSHKDPSSIKLVIAIPGVGDCFPDPVYSMQWVGRAPN